jgi:hypothetical protein
MSRYDRSYDFGMRGYPQTTRPLARRPMRRPRYDRYFDGSYSAADGDFPMLNRVTQRYNREYVDDRLNAARAYGYGGVHSDRTVDESFYRRPYSTIGGTRTMRGSNYPERYSPGRFGPSYGGRYPDEL